MKPEKVEIMKVYKKTRFNPIETEPAEKILSILNPLFSLDSKVRSEVTAKVAAETKLLKAIQKQPFYIKVEVPEIRLQQ